MTWQIINFTNRKDTMMNKIVISGSMQFLEDMRACKSPLEEKGFEIVLPDEDDWDNIKPEEINEYKRLVSKKHFDSIANSDTSAILVVNNSKKGIDNYIGANTFAEIAIAFYFGKKIYLLNDIYESYSDELLAWGAISLNGNINILK